MRSLPTRLAIYGAALAAVHFAAGEMTAALSANDNDVQAPPDFVFAVTDTGDAIGHYDAMTGAEISRVPYQVAFPTGTRKG